MARQFAHRGLRERRLAAGLRLEHVAIRIGRSAGQVDNLEHGRSLPSVAVLIALAELFDCGVDDLFTADQPEPAPIAA